MVNKIKTFFETVGLEINKKKSVTNLNDATLLEGYEF